MKAYTQYLFYILIAFFLPAAHSTLLVFENDISIIDTSNESSKDKETIVTMSTQDHPQLYTFAL